MGCPFSYFLLIEVLGSVSSLNFSFSLWFIGYSHDMFDLPLFEKWLMYEGPGSDFMDWWMAMTEKYCNKKVQTALALLEESCVLHIKCEYVSKTTWDMVSLKVNQHV